MQGHGSTGHRSETTRGGLHTHDLASGFSGLRIQTIVDGYTVTGPHKTHRPLHRHRSGAILLREYGFQIQRGARFERQRCDGLPLIVDHLQGIGVNLRIGLRTKPFQTGQGVALGH